jgi:prepilin-type N-terminal cleavage/methylation domain-containing protein
MHIFNSKGFTLIELLIVVAIIGILASLAMVNILQAQIRAKVTRAKADMYTISVGIEAYAVDYNVHPADYFLQNQSGLSLSGREGLYKITTPIDYLNSLPYDTFFEVNEEEGTYFYDGPGPKYCESFQTYSACQMYLINGYYWCTSSYGPARTRITKDGIWLYASQMLATGPGSILPRPKLTYDPTNGTISFGLIVHSNKGFF